MKLSLIRRAYKYQFTKATMLNCSSKYVKSVGDLLLAGVLSLGGGILFTVGAPFMMIRFALSPLYLVATKPEKMENAMDVMKVK